MVEKPKGISDFAEQLRPPIVRGKGTTDSERYLAKLGERSFLNLWSYPNPHRTLGKELCDLLVVCGPHVIIFSEKTIQWSEKPVDIAWARWFKKAVWESFAQICGAERWLTSYPDRVFIDPSCEVRFPIPIPQSPYRILHRVVVAMGAGESCRKHFGGESGSLRIRPGVLGRQHFEVNAGTIEPFCVGDIDPAGAFVHVLDDVSLDIIMRELDTISDFTSYLQKKEAFIRAGRLRMAAGEADLLAYYAVHINNDGDHDFTVPSNADWLPEQSIEIGSGQYNGFVANPQYRAKKEADEESYLWDRLIKVFTDHMVGGTSIVLAGYEYDLSKSEMGVRYMALESRYRRRNLSRAIFGALAAGRKREVFFRAMISPKDSKDNETAFFILTLAFQKYMESEGYDKYREARTSFATIYAKAMLMRHPHLKRIIGISMEPPGSKHGSSEDMIYAVQSEWSKDEREISEADCTKLGIMQPTMKETHIDDQEFPLLEPRGMPIRTARKPAPTIFHNPAEWLVGDATTANWGANRKQRRAARSKENKANRKRK